MKKLKEKIRKKLKLLNELLIEYAIASSYAIQR
jgi:hypothetical protein